MSSSRVQYPGTPDVPGKFERGHTRQPGVPSNSRVSCAAYSANPGVNEFCIADISGIPGFIEEYHPRHTPAYPGSFGSRVPYVPCTFRMSLTRHTRRTRAFEGSRTRNNRVFRNGAHAVYYVRPCMFGVAGRAYLSYPMYPCLSERRHSRCSSCAYLTVYYEI